MNIPRATDDLPDRLKAARRKARLSQREAAEALGVSQPHLSKVERGNTPPSPLLAARILEWVASVGVGRGKASERRALELARLIQEHSRELARLFEGAAS